MIRFYCSKCHTILLNNKDRCFKCGNGVIIQIDINVHRNDKKSS